MEKITLTTPDKIKLAGLLWNQQAFASVLLLPMMPANKESWVDLADRLAAVGLNVLAIDLRGHGESAGGDYHHFTDQQHQQYYIDATAAVEYLEHTFPHTEIYLGGASIGGNIAIKYMAEHTDVAKGFALSAGLDYHGIRGSEDVKRLDPVQKLLFVGSYDDYRGGDINCGQQAQQLYDTAEGVKDKIIYDSGGHGTELLANHPELIDKLVDFLTT